MNKRSGCGLAALAFLGLALFGVWRARTPPTISNSVPITQLPPAEQKARREDAHKLETQVSKLAQAAKEKQHKTFELVVSADQLNTLLQDRLQTEKFPIQNLRAGIAPDQLLVRGDIDYKGFQGVATLGGTLAAQDGKLVYNVQSLQVGGLPLPGKWRDKVEAQITEKLNETLLKTPGRIDSVQLEQDKMTIKGTTD